MQLYLADLWWSFLLLAVGSYLIGSISFARIISFAKNKDITKIGSGNPGTMNMSREFGLGIGLLTLFLDMAKGAIPALVGALAFKNMYFGDSPLEVAVTAQYIAGFFAVVGHIFPVYYKFKGGKGIATTIGVFLVGEWYITLIFVAIALAYILITGMGSMGSFIATTPSAIAAALRLYSLGFAGGVKFDYGITFFSVSMVLILGIIGLTWYAHKKNIKKLLAGEEHETSWTEMIRKAKIKRKMKKLGIDGGAHGEPDASENAATLYNNDSVFENANLEKTENEHDENGEETDNFDELD